MLALGPSDSLIRPRVEQDALKLWRKHTCYIISVSSSKEARGYCKKHSVAPFNINSKEKQASFNPMNMPHFNSGSKRYNADALHSSTPSLRQTSQPHQTRQSAHRQTGSDRPLQSVSSSPSTAQTKNMFDWYITERKEIRIIRIIL